MEMKKILVVEDEVKIRENLTDILELNGFDVKCAQDGLEAFRLLKKEKPDLILSDIMMPNLNGYQLKELLEDDEDLKTIPFIFLTAKAELDEMRKGMVLGADDYLVKPFNSKDLVNSINKRMEKFNNLAGLNSKNDQNEKRKNYDDRVLVDTNDLTRLIELKSITHIESDGNYTELYLTDKNKVRIKKTLKYWEEILPENNFRRIHHNTIINLNFIDKIERLTNRSLIIKLKNIDKVIIVSQRFTIKLKDILSV